MSEFLRNTVTVVGDYADLDESATDVADVVDVANNIDTAVVTEREAPPAPTLSEYMQGAWRNLLAMSRTAQGVVDTSASAGKADSMTGVTGDAAAELAQFNYCAAIRTAHENRYRTFHSPDELRGFVEGLATKINRGIVKDGSLIRSTDSDKYPYVRIAQLEDYARTFYRNLYNRTKNPTADPVEAAAYAEFGIDFAGHFFADGCGKVAKVVSSYMLMRAGHALPEYRGGRAAYYANQLPQIAGQDPIADAAGYRKFLNYYRGLFDDQATQPEQSTYFAATTAERGSKALTAANFDPNQGSEYYVYSPLFDPDIINDPYQLNKYFPNTQAIRKRHREIFASISKELYSYNTFAVDPRYGNTAVYNSHNKDLKEHVDPATFWQPDRLELQDRGISRQFHDAILLSKSMRAAERERGIPPTIYALRGAPGSGKTFACRQAGFPGMIIQDGEPFGTLATDNSKTDLYRAGGTSDQIHTESSRMYRYTKRHWDDYVRSQGNDCSELHDRTFDCAKDIAEILESAAKTSRRVEMLDIDVPYVVSAVRVLLRPKDAPEPHPGSRYLEQAFTNVRNARTANHNESILCQDADPSHTGQLLRAANEDGLDITYKLLCYDYKSKPKTIQREAAHLEKDPDTGQTHLVITDQALFDQATDEQATKQEIANVKNQIIDQRFVDWYCETFFEPGPDSEKYIKEVRDALAEYVERGLTIYEALDDKNA